MSRKLASAPVRWTLGQPLLPDHFEAQEQAIRDEARVRAAGLGAPRHGLVRLRWDAGPLDGGVLRIQDLTLVTPRGRVLDIPGNADPVALDLEETGQSRVLAHLLHAPRGADGVSGEDRQEGALTRAVEPLGLVASPGAAPEGELYPLAAFVKDMEGAWALDPGFVPPCLSVGQVPFFRPVLDQLRTLADRFQHQLRADVRDDYLAGHRIASAQQAMRAVFGFEGLLADLEAELDPHPYTLFTAARSFYVDVCIYRELRPAEAELAYEHDGLAEGFGRLLDALGNLLTPAGGRRSRASYVSFGRSDGLVVAELPIEARRSRQLFLLVQTSAKASLPDFGRLKLASPSRLPVVHRRSLRGVPLAPLEGAPFHHEFASDVRFFALELGDEWDQAVSERAVAFLDRPELQGIRLHLYWR